MTRSERGGGRIVAFIAPSESSALRRAAAALLS